MSGRPDRPFACSAPPTVRSNLTPVRVKLSLAICKSNQGLTCCQPSSENFFRRIGIRPQTPASTVRFLRVDEAARILRIGRSAAYEQANRWIATNGQCGLPAVKVGRMIRIPAAVLEAWATTGSDAEPISESR